MSSFTLTQFKANMYGSIFFGFFTMGAPLIAVPLIAYKFHNWWVLIGIVAAFIGASIAEVKRMHLLFYLAAMFCIGFWIRTGFNIHQYVTFFFFCLLFGFMFYQITMAYRSTVLTMKKEIDMELEKVTNE
jgi:hypothetical protein